MSPSIIRSVVSGLVALGILLPALAAENKLHTAGNEQFEIVGLDSRSVSYVDELSQHIVQVAKRYLDPDELQFPQRILISLKPLEYVDFETEYEVRVGERGFVNLDIKWAKSLPLRTTCRAITEALLVRYSILNYGVDGLDYLPKWPATAIGTKAYLSLRPAQSALISDWFDQEALALGPLLQRKWTDAAPDANGFALLLAMERSGFDRKDVSKLIIQSLGGVDIIPSLTEELQSSDPLAVELKLDDWWSHMIRRVLAPEEELIESMSESRIWIEALSDFSSAEKEDISLRKLWAEREDEAITELIEARYEILKLRIVQVNPAYFNAARSLGALFETYLVGGKRHKFIHSLTAFFSDFEDAKVLEEAVTKALGGE